MQYIICSIHYAEFSKQGWDKRPSISLHDGNTPILLRGAIVMKNPTNLEFPSMTHFPTRSCSFFTSDLRVSQLIERIITSLLVIGLDLQSSRFDTSWYVLVVIIGLQQFDALPISYFILCNFDSIELVHLKCWINVTIDHLRWLIQNDSHRFKWLRL